MRCAATLGELLVGIQFCIANADVGRAVFFLDIYILVIISSLLERHAEDAEGSVTGHIVQQHEET